MKVKFVGSYENQVAFTCSGVAPVILNIGDAIDIPDDVFEAELKDDPRFEALGGSGTEKKVESKTEKKGKVK